MLEELYRKARETGADMVICDFYYDYKWGKVVDKQKPEVCTPEGVQRELFLQKLHGSCCNKLIRRSCYEEYQVKFPQNITLWEDLYVVCSLLSHPLKVAYLPKAFYHYDQTSNGNSLVRKPTMQAMKSQELFIDHFRSCGYKLDSLYPCMRAAKEMAYSSGLVSNKDVVNLYSEINDMYLADSRPGLLSKGLRALIKGKELKSQFYKSLRSCFLFVKIIKRLL